MTRASLGRESTAAYAASQPLFNALHEATQRIDEQKYQLSKARDTVKRTHVKLAQNEENGVHDTYVAAALKAWRSATETYGKIFVEMAEITAADPGEGREAVNGHEVFLSLAESAKKGNELAMSFKLPQSNITGPSPGAKRAAGSDEKSTKRARVHSREGDEDDAWASKVHQETTAPAGSAHAAKPLVARTKRASPTNGTAVNAKRSRKAVTRAQTLNVVHDHPPHDQPQPTAQPFSNGQENRMPGVEYEDLTADVEARIKAKAEKKRAKKQQEKEKKRKRDSADSNAPDFAGMLARAEKPAKKKTKAETDAAESTPGKRKVELPADTNEGGAAQKKRKKRHFPSA